MVQLQIVLMILMGLAVVANIVVLVGFFRRKMYTEFFHQAYLNLAVSDLVMSVHGLACWELDLLNLAYSDFWSNMRCNLQIIVTDVNLLAIVGITTDRFFAAFFPTCYKRRSHRWALTGIISFAWVYPALEFSIFHLALQEPLAYFNRTTKHCILSPKMTGHWYGYLRNLVTKLLPLLFNIITYSFIIYKINSRGRMTLSSKIASLKAVLICVCFTVSWLPVFLSLYTNIKINVAVVLLYMNCLLDPLFYSISTEAIKRVIRKIRPDQTATEGNPQNIETPKMEDLPKTEETKANLQLTTL